MRGFASCSACYQRARTLGARGKNFAQLFPKTCPLREIFEVFDGKRADCAFSKSRVDSLYLLLQTVELRYNEALTCKTKLCADEFETSTSPPRATPRAFELLKIGLFKFPSLGAKKPFKCPTNYY